MKDTSGNDNPPASRSIAEVFLPYVKLKITKVPTVVPVMRTQQ